MRGFLDGEEPESNPGPPRPEIVDEMAEALSSLELDVLALQEAPDEDRTNRLGELLQMDVHHCSAGWLGNEKWQGGFPGAILSRIPMTDSKDLRKKYCSEKNTDCFIRHWGSAKINGITMHSTHLAVHDPGKRLRELHILMDHCVPADMPATNTIILGDCNFHPHTAEYNFMLDHGFVDVFDACAKEDAYQHSCPSIKPRTRIDFIWASGDLTDRLQSCEILFEEPYGPRASDNIALSDHLPVVCELNI